MKYLKVLALGSVVVLLLAAMSGCMDLAVENPNDPDRLKAIVEPKDVESLIAGTYLTWWSGTQKDNDFPSLTLSTMADAHTSSWGNFGMQDLSSEPRIAHNNSPSYSYAGVNRLTWDFMYRAISNANDGLTAIAGGIKIVETLPDGTKKDNTKRAQAFAKFVQGIAHAWLACFFDKAFIVDENTDINAFQANFKTPAEVMAAALKMLDEAEQLASAPFPDPIPTTWINGVTLTNTEFLRVLRSYRARFRASVARTVAERRAVDWAKVITDAGNGVNVAEWGPQGDGNFWWDGLKFRGQHATWTRGDYKTIGLADTAGLYTAWLNTPVSARNVFVIRTPDRRITGSPAGTISGTHFAYRTTSPFRDDRGTYHHSLYNHRRFEYHVLLGATGLMTHITLAEMDLLRAEGLWYQSPTANRLAVVDIINRTRVPAGWGALTIANTDAEIWTWLKYEKMIMTFATASGIPFYDRRGWGELVKGTVIDFPVPGKELENLLLPIYTRGGEGLPGGAPKSSRNWLVPLSTISVH